MHARDLVRRVLHRHRARCPRSDPFVQAGIAAEQVVAVELEDRAVGQHHHPQRGPLAVHQHRRLLDHVDATDPAEELSRVVEVTVLAVDTPHLLGL